MIDGRFETERLVVQPWREALAPTDLNEFLVDLLTPAVTADLPPGWQGVFHTDRASTWAAERDAESTQLLVTEAGVPVGVLIVAVERAGVLRLGYLLAERAWGRGIATEVVGGLVERCRSSPGVHAVLAGVAIGNDRSSSVLRTSGFEPLGPPTHGEQLYRVDVGQAVRVRPEQPRDHEAIRRVVIAAFGSNVEGDLVERIRASPDYVPDMALVAELGGSVDDSDDDSVDGEIVGHVMISGAVIRHASGTRPTVLLSPLAVAPAHQRRGIGARLVDAACATADRRGEPLVVLEGNPAYYCRFGFEHSVDHGLTLPLPDWAPSEAGQVTLLSSHDPTDDTLRGEVVYPEAFDDMEP